MYLLTRSMCPVNGGGGLSSAAQQGATDKASTKAPREDLTGNANATAFFIFASPKVCTAGSPSFDLFAVRRDREQGVSRRHRGALAAKDVEHRPGRRGMDGNLRLHGFD